jgi:Flp pilus assembly protein TadG
VRIFNDAAWMEEGATTAVEFAIVAPVFIFLLVGILYVCLALFAVGSLYYAVEEGARCASIASSNCSSPDAILAYTKSRYFGPSSTPVFTYNVAACGNSVNASANYVMDLAFKQFTVPINAAACFP